MCQGSHHRHSSASAVALSDERSCIEAEHPALPAHSSTTGGVQRRFLCVSAGGKPTKVVRRAVSTPFVLVVAFLPFSWRRSAALPPFQELLASHFFSDGVVAWRLSLCILFSLSYALAVFHFFSSYRLPNRCAGLLPFVSILHLPFRFPVEGVDFFLSCCWLV